MPLAPAFLAAFVRRMASGVLFEPVPAMTLIRPRARSHDDGDDALVLVVRERRRFAGGAARGEASVPCSQCQSTSLPRSSQSISPFGTA